MVEKSGKKRGHPYRKVDIKRSDGNDAKWYDDDGPNRLPLPPLQRFDKGTSV